MPQVRILSPRPYRNASIDTILAFLFFLPEVFDVNVHGNKCLVHHIILSDVTKLNFVDFLLFSAISDMIIRKILLKGRKI